ncbi:hypothetical protein DM02DRAFT_611895 [Periconia macrospinosa]|uniref:Uncharacterized protein n=1 Tax=Periconia macrospinosa TaxID=97972 RepID=A0A2V1E3D2_9PLEO|nr:hypothetical protein DM02DRAFT_611895 [Periconia macrospinosa]
MPPYLRTQTEVCVSLQSFARAGGGCFQTLCRRLCYKEGRSVKYDVCSVISWATVFTTIIRAREELVLKALHKKKGV